MAHNTNITPTKVHKDSKLGVIPEGWNVFKFKDVAKFNPKSDVLPEKFIYVDLESVKDGKLQHENIVFKKNAPSRAQRLLKKGDILFQTVRPYQKNNLLFDHSGDYVASTGYAQIRVKTCGSFIYQLLYSNYVINQVMARCTGTSFPAISSKDLSKISIKLPPLPEQQKIAKILSVWDKAITKQDALIAQKQHLKKGLMQQLLTGKKRLSGFDGEWEEVRIGDISKSFSGGTPSSKNRDYYDGHIHWIKSGELNQVRIRDTEDFISELGLKNSSAKIVEPNTLLVAMYGATAGVCAITEIKGAINQAVLAIVPFEKIDNTFLFQKLRMKMPSIVHAMTQGGQPNLSGGIIKNVKIKIPEIKEQQKIAAVLTAADQEITALQEQLRQLKTQKQGLMQVLLTGKIRVKIN